MFQVNLYKRPFIRLKRSFEVICPRWHYLGIMNIHIFTKFDSAKYRKEDNYQLRKM